MNIEPNVGGRCRLMFHVEVMSGVRRELCLRQERTPGRTRHQIADARAGAAGCVDRTAAGRIAFEVRRVDDEMGDESGRAELDDRPVVSRSPPALRLPAVVDRKSTRLNSSHVATSYAV